MATWTDLHKKVGTNFYERSRQNCYLCETLMLNRARVEALETENICGCIESIALYQTAKSANVRMLRCCLRSIGIFPTGIRTIL